MGEHDAFGIARRTGGVLQQRKVAAFARAAAGQVER